MLPTRDPEYFKPSDLGPYSRNRTDLYIAAVILLNDINDQWPAKMVLGDGSKSSTATRGRRRRNPGHGEACILVFAIRHSNRCQHQSARVVTGRPTGPRYLTLKFFFKVDKKCIRC